MIRGACVRSKRGIAIWTVGRGFSSRRNWRAITFVHEKKFDAAANWRIAIIIADGKEEKKNRAQTIANTLRFFGKLRIATTQFPFLVCDSKNKNRSSPFDRIVDEFSNTRTKKRIRELRYSRLINEINKLSWV